MSNENAKPARKRKPWKVVLLILLIVILTVLLIGGGYFAYLMLSYSRIEDNQTQEIKATGESASLQTGKDYVAVTNNIGFGAYTPDFTFFMDGGTQSWAASEDSVKQTIQAAMDTCLSLQPDFLLLQEVDTDSTRTYHIDESELVRSAAPAFSSVFANNYHSAFLMYPFTQPHGSSNSGLMTLAKNNPTGAVRYSLPIAESLSKFLDLDRCFLVTRYPVDNGKEFVLVNVHTSAYGNDETVREQQMNKLLGFLQAEYEKGNYVLCGGDFNHDFTGNSVPTLNGVDAGERTWAQPFPVEMLPAGIRRLDTYKDGKTVASCRDCDIPFGEDSFLLIVDGFLASANVEAVELENVWVDFAYSDHQPVRLTFRLQ